MQLLITIFYNFYYKFSMQ